MRRFRSGLAFLVVVGACISTGQMAFAAASLRCNIAEHGAVGNGTTLNTTAIQAAIDECASRGGGTLVVPKGEFVTGSLFLKPGVNLELQEGAVLKASTNIDDFPIKSGNRFEGHFEDWRAAIVNAEKTDHLRVMGPGTIDGNGPVYWRMHTPNGRPRNLFVRDSSDVVVSGVHFKDSASWNLHFYNCKNVTVENSRFEIPAGSPGPSTDGIDIDSSQNVTVRHCYFSVNDDCVCLKGNRYDGLNQKPASPPVQHVRVTECTFARGMGALTLGTEATEIHDVEFDHSTVTGRMPMLRLKMRPDTTGQHYQNVRVHDIKLDGTGKVLSWEPTHGTKAKAKPPLGVIENIVVSNITGSFGSFGSIAGNDNSAVKNIVLKNIDLKLQNPELNTSRTSGVVIKNVVINGRLFTLKNE
ncbi:MAG TPA: glycosyl hydrolase family 28 protein [Bryobacteraceae bacterium]|nr:glycosyl hydrolase family 28 protein [Bryobacteraceae bacterium]